jgi:hypothetical protein
MRIVMGIVGSPLIVAVPGRIVQRYQVYDKSEGRRLFESGQRSGFFPAVGGLAGAAPGALNVALGAPGTKVEEKREVNHRSAAARGGGTARRAGITSSTAKRERGCRFDQAAGYPY